MSKTLIRRSIRAAIVIVGVAGLARTPAYAAGGESARPAITGAKVFLAGDKIVSTVTTTGLFSEEIVGTVQSGLPAVVELLYSLVGRDNKTLDAGIHTIELRYDVWENVYSAERVDTTSRFSSFAAMASAVQTLRRVTIVPLSALRPNTEYAIRLSVAIHPLQGRGQEEIAGWVGEHVRSGSEGSLREQVLNLNDLIEHFFARDKSPANRSDWYRTEFFNPGILPTADEEDK